MLRAMARTRPMRSPSQPNSTPPVAAPTRKPAVTTPNHKPIRPSSAVAIKSLIAGRPTIENTPISNPSNIQPRRASRAAATGSRNFRGGSGWGATAWALVARVWRQATLTSHQDGSVTPGPASSDEVGLVVGVERQVEGGGVGQPAAAQLLARVGGL